MAGEGVEKMVVKEKDAVRGNIVYAKRTQKKSALTTRYVPRLSRHFLGHPQQHSRQWSGETSESLSTTKIPLTVLGHAINYYTSSNQLLENEEPRTNIKIYKQCNFRKQVRRDERGGNKPNRQQMRDERTSIDGVR